MSDDLDLKIFETKAELAGLKEEINEIRDQNNELRNEMALRTFIETVNEVQSKVDILSTNFKEIRQTVTALSNRVSNHDENFSKLNENLRKLNETLTKYDATLSQHNGIPTKQNETTQILNTNENNLEKQTILLLGGFDGMKSDSLLMLGNDGQNWKELNIKLPYSICNHGAQFLNNNLYIFGGNRSYTECLNWTYTLSKSLQWEKMANMNQKRWAISNSSVILNNQIWVCGGENGQKELKSVEMYDPETNKWKYMKQMKEFRSYAAAAVVNGKIFCSGGIYNYNSLNSVECYDRSSDVWTRISNMPQKIWGHGVVEMNGNLIVMGGTKCGKYFKDVWALDTTDKNAKWIEKPSMSRTRYKFSISKIHDKIFICGGRPDEGELTDPVEIFDGEVWRNGPKIPTERYYAAAVAIPMEFARSLN